MAFEKNVYEVVGLPGWHDWHSAVDVSFALQMIVEDTSARSAAMALWILNSQKTGGDLCLAVKRFMRDLYIQRIGARPTKKDVKDALAQHFGKDEHSIKAQVLNAHRQNFGDQYLDRTSKRKKISTRDVMV